MQAYSTAQYIAERSEGGRKKSTVSLGDVSSAAKLQGGERGLAWTQRAFQAARNPGIVY